MKLDGKFFGCGLVVGAALLLLVAWRMNKSEAKTKASLANTATATWGDAQVCELLKPIRARHGVPAVAVVIVTSKGAFTIGGVGGRKRGADVGITADDLWHLGSNTKTMTATLVARLVEKGKLKWETPLVEIFPDEGVQFHPEMKTVTMLSLLSHRAGLPPNAEWRRFNSHDVKSERLKVLREEVAKAPRHKPGSHYEYSNLGYVIAGAVIEKVTGKTWEEAIQTELFDPLEMKSAAFGGTGTLGKIDQPWPHTSAGMPVSKNGPDMDNPPVLGPAGRVHCTIRDWAKFIQDQLHGARGESGTLLKSNSYQEMQTPTFGDGHAIGWGVGNWQGRKALAHQGSNTMNFANVVIVPELDLAILVCVNQGGDAALKATAEAITALLDSLNNPEKVK